MTRLIAAAGVVALTANADGSLTLSAEQVQAIEAFLEGQETTAQQQQEEMTSLQSGMAETGRQLEAANARIAELEKEPGAEPAAITPNTDGNQGSEASDNMWTRLQEVEKILK